MECGAVIVAGFGFRKNAPVESLADALAQASTGYSVGALATLASKADGLEDLAQTLHLPCIAVGKEALEAQETATTSEASLKAYETGSVAEAAALAAAGPGARLLRPRQISRDGMATCALAEGARP